MSLADALARHGLDAARLAAAESAVRPWLPPTPLWRAERLSARLGAEVWLKLESVTPIRTFKLRGALAKVAALARRGSLRGIATASAGNHGLAAAWAARAHGVPATVFVPEGANPQKVEAIARVGATVVRGGRDYQEAHERSVAFASAHGLDLVHAYDDADVVAGQATLGRELAGTWDGVWVGVGGGGLIAGLVAGGVSGVVGVQPEGADSLARSIEAGAPVTLGAVRTAADGLGARRPGDIALDVVRAAGIGVARVPDDALRDAAVLLLREERLVGELAGVAGLAGLLAAGATGRHVVVLSGANVSDAFLAEICGRVG